MGRLAVTEQQVTSTHPSYSVVRVSLPIDVSVSNKGTFRLPRLLRF